MEYANGQAKWVKWLAEYGPEKFYDSFMRTAQDAQSECVSCGHFIYLDIREGGGVPDWRTTDGDYGCVDSLTGSHSPILL